MKIDIEERVFHFKQPAGTSRGVYTERKSWIVRIKEERGKATGRRAELGNERKEEREERESLKTRLQSLCREHLPKYWQPRDFVFAEKLPMTETGKPARKQAEELATQNYS